MWQTIYMHVPSHFIGNFRSSLLGISFSSLWEDGVFEYSICYATGKKNSFFSHQCFWYERGISPSAEGSNFSQLSYNACIPHFCAASHWSGTMLQSCVSLAFYLCSHLRVSKLVRKPYTDLAGICYFKCGTTSDSFSSGRLANAV